jgi:anti-sigma B factor antagonist
MKALLICPDPRPAVVLLAEASPLIIAPLLGKSLVEYWIEYLESRGIDDIQLVASDRPDRIASEVGDGARWGMHIETTPEDHELSSSEASDKYGAESPPEFLVQADHLPGRPAHRLFESYAAWFAGLRAWIPQAQQVERIGQCEIQPGVWVGLRSRIHESAQLVAPCWLGDHVSVRSDAVIGPGAILENGVVVGEGAHVVNSVVGPATFVGAHTQIENSIARGHRLINWSNNSCACVPDACWLSCLRKPSTPPRPADIWPGGIRVEAEGDRLSVTELGELSASNASHFMAKIRTALPPGPALMEIDLTHLRFVDSCGLATLGSLHRVADPLGVRMRLLNPHPAVQQLLELTRLHELFEIAHVEPIWPGMPRPAITRAREPLVARTDGLSVSL